MLREVKVLHGTRNAQLTRGEPGLGGGLLSTLLVVDTRALETAHIARDLESEHVIKGRGRLLSQPPG